MDIVGMNELKKVIDEDCSKSMLYSRTNFHPRSKIVYLDEHEGRTTVLEYISKRYKENNILDFYTSLDDFLELKFTGSYDNFKDCVSLVKNKADFSNSFQGVIGIDGLSLVNHRQEEQWRQFLDLIYELSTTTVLVFFMPSHFDKSSDLYLEAIRSKIVKIEEIKSSFNTNDFSNIVIGIIQEMGILLDCDLVSSIEKTVKEQEIKSVQQSVNLGIDLAQFAQFDKKKLRFSEESLKNYGGIK